MEDVSNLLNHTRAAPLRVVGKKRHKISSGVYCKLKVVLKVVMWSSGSFKPSNDSSCGSRNFGRKGHSKILVVKGEFVLLTVLSKFLSIFSLITLFSSSISFLMFLWRFELASSEEFGCRESSLLQLSLSFFLLVPTFVGERFSSCYNYNLISWFCLVSFSMLAVSVWICSASAVKSCRVLDSVWILELNGTTFLDWGMKLSSPRTAPNWWCKNCQ